MYIRIDHPNGMGPKYIGLSPWFLQSSRFNFSLLVAPFEAVSSFVIQRHKGKGRPHLLRGRWMVSKDGYYHQYNILVTREATCAGLTMETSSGIVKVPREESVDSHGEYLFSRMKECDTTGTTLTIADFYSPHECNRLSKNDAMNSIVQDNWKRFLAMAQLFTMATKAGFRGPTLKAV